MINLKETVVPLNFTRVFCLGYRSPRLSPSGRPLFKSDTIWLGTCVTVPIYSWFSPKKRRIKNFVSKRRPPLRSPSQKGDDTEPTFLVTNWSIKSETKGCCQVSIHKVGGWRSSEVQVEIIKESLDRLIEGLNPVQLFPLLNVGL